MRLSIRIDFEPSGDSLGPGMAELLDRISRLGSIRRAAASMEMSYRKAWFLIQGMQQTFGRPVVATETGGSFGGGAQLTAFGSLLLRTYRSIENNASHAASGNMRSLSRLMHKDAKSKQQRH